MPQKAYVVSESKCSHIKIPTLKSFVKILKEVNEENFAFLSAVATGDQLQSWFTS